MVLFTRVLWLLYIHHIIVLIIYDGVAPLIEAHIHGSSVVPSINPCTLEDWRGIIIIVGSLCSTHATQCEHVHIKRIVHNPMRFTQHGLPSWRTLHRTIRYKLQIALWHSTRYVNISWMRSSWVLKGLHV